MNRVKIVSCLQVGGQKSIRDLWRHYYQGAEGLIFVIDSNDRERINEAREELRGILESSYMSHVPVVIIANKQDFPSESSLAYFFFDKIMSILFSLIDAMKPSEIIEKLGMNDFQGKHQWYLQPACAITGDGVMESMLEMSDLVKKYRKENK